MNGEDAETLEDAEEFLEALGETVAEFATVEVGRMVMLVV